MGTELNLREAAAQVAPAVANLPHLRDAAIATWRGRMVNEYGSSKVFEALSAQMKDAGFDEKTVNECRGFADEERNHGVLCGAVVEALTGEAVATLPDGDEFPNHEDAPNKVEGVLRNLLSVSCLSETIAVALIGAEREEMPEGALRTLLTTIWSDEIGHAKFGWRIVREASNTLDAEAKERLADYLEVAFGHVEDHELRHLPVQSQPPKEGAILGLCSGSDARGLLYSTISDVIIPALEECGIPAARAWNNRVSFAA